MAEGFWQAGFNVIGVDIKAQSRYPFKFIQADVLTLLADTDFMKQFAAAHTSPPCQAHSDLQKQNKREYPDLIEPTRELLQHLDLPYTIENVEGAPLIDPVTICGASVPGVRVIRHRRFESNWLLSGVDCPRNEEGRVVHPLVFTHDKRKAHHGKLDQNSSYVQVTGGGNCTLANKRAAMGMPWASAHGCNEAVPPAYGKIIGEQLMRYLSAGEEMAA
jgi:DNA (cytosine-5)-methyltransferase 1